MSSLNPSSPKIEPFSPTDASPTQCPLAPSTSAISLLSLCTGKGRDFAKEAQPLPSSDKRLSVPRLATTPGFGGSRYGSRGAVQPSLAAVASSSSPVAWPLQGIQIPARAASHASTPDTPLMSPLSLSFSKPAAAASEQLHPGRFS